MRATRVVSLVPPRLYFPPPQKVVAVLPPPQIRRRSRVRRAASMSFPPLRLQHDPSEKPCKTLRFSRNPAENKSQQVVAVLPPPPDRLRSGLAACRSPGGTADTTLVRCTTAEPHNGSRPREWRIRNSAKCSTRSAPRRSLPRLDPFLGDWLHARSLLLRFYMLPTIPTL